MEETPSPIGTQTQLVAMCAAAGGDALPVLNLGAQDVQIDPIDDQASMAESTTSASDLRLASC